LFSFESGKSEFISNSNNKFQFQKVVDILKFIKKIDELNN